VLPLTPPSLSVTVIVANALLLSFRSGALPFMPTVEPPDRFALMGRAQMGVSLSHQRASVPHQCL
jgi:hypothetical protein